MREKRGFTILEFIIVVVLLGIIAGVTVPLMLEINAGYAIASKRNEVSESARMAMDRVVREIRRIKDTTSVIAASNTAFQFINTSNNTITFNKSGTTLRRTIDGTTNALVENASSLTLTYYDENDAVIATPMVSPDSTDIRRIQIDLVLSLGGTQFSFRSQVSPRRLN